MEKLETPAKRLRWAREKDGRYETGTAAAEAFGWKVSTYLGHENGDRVPKRSTAKRYAAVYGVPWEWILEGGTLEHQPATNEAIITKGEVAAGRWLDLDAEVDSSAYRQHPIAADPRYPFEAQYGLVVLGTSINRIAVAGDVLHCVDFALSGLQPQDGDLVIVERRRAQLGQKEVTAKRISRSGSVIVLSPDSTDGRWKPLELDNRHPPDDEEIALVALVLGVYRSLRNTK